VKINRLLNVPRRAAVKHLQLQRGWQKECVGFRATKAETKRDSFSIEIFTDTKGLIYLINTFQVWSFYQNITSGDFWCGFCPAHTLMATHL